MTSPGDGEIKVGADELDALPPLGDPLAAPDVPAPSPEDIPPAVRAHMQHLEGKLDDMRELLLRLAGNQLTQQATEAHDTAEQWAGPTQQEVPADLTPHAAAPPLMVAPEPIPAPVEPAPMADMPPFAEPEPAGPVTPDLMPGDLPDVPQPPDLALPPMAAPDSGFADPAVPHIPGPPSGLPAADTSAELPPFMQPIEEDDDYAPAAASPGFDQPAHFPQDDPALHQPSPLPQDPGLPPAPDLALPPTAADPSAELPPFMQPIEENDDYAPAAASPGFDQPAHFPQAPNLQADPHLAPPPAEFDPSAETQAHGGYATSPFEQFPVVDILAAVASRNGAEGAMQMQEDVGLSELRQSAREATGKTTSQKPRTMFNSLRKGQPKFLDISRFQFRPGHPLVLTVTSPKGGVGKSTTSANLAAYLARAAQIAGVEDQVRVLLVDGDVANGNLALRVANRLKPNMLDVLKNMDAQKAAGQPIGDFQRDLGQFVLAHPELPNLDILAAPDNPDIINEITQKDLETMMIQMFSAHYQVVIFDSGTQIVEHTNQAWMAFSSQVYAMVEPELTCLQSTTDFLKRASGLQLITPDRIRVIMIRATMELDGFNREKVMASTFPYVPPDRAFYIGDYHRDAIQTGNAGEFLVLQSAAYAEELTPIVASALETYAQQQH